MVPRVSVVIPTKGRPELVCRAIKTVFDQTISDIELIVVVDGADPETEARLAAISDSRLKVIVNATSLGGALTRNVGGDAATGEWVAFLDDDDEWLPNKLECQFQTIAALSPEAAQNCIVTCLSLFITPFGEGIRPREPYDGSMPVDIWLFDRRQIFGGGAFFQTSSMMMNSELFRRIRFMSPRQHDEWDLLLRAVKEWNTTFVCTREVLVRHYSDDNRVSLTNKHKLQDSIDWLDSVPDLISPRAYSGFCLTVIPQHAVRHNEYVWFITLLRRAYMKGSPTFLQLVVFLSLWIAPVKGWRRRLNFRLTPRRQNLYQLIYSAATAGR